MISKWWRRKTFSFSSSCPMLMPLKLLWNNTSLPYWLILPHCWDLLQNWLDARTRTVYLRSTISGFNSTRSSTSCIDWASTVAPQRLSSYCFVETSTNWLLWLPSPNRTMRTRIIIRYITAPTRQDMLWLMFDTTLLILIERSYLYQYTEYQWVVHGKRQSTKSNSIRYCFGKIGLFCSLQETEKAFQQHQTLKPVDLD